MGVLNWLRERIGPVDQRRSAEEPAATRPLWVPAPDDDPNGEDAGPDGGDGGDFGAGDGGGGGGDGGGAG